MFALQPTPNPLPCFQVQIIEKVTPNTGFMRLEREEFWIKKFVNKAPFGLNIMD
jgi:hypothetical protein